MLNNRKNKAEKNPKAVANTTITVSAGLRCWITGLGASLGMYPPARSND